MSLLSACSLMRLESESDFVVDSVLTDVGVACLDGTGSFWDCLQENQKDSHHQFEMFPKFEMF